VAAAAGNGDRVSVQAGDVVRLRLPWSEVCMHMRVAGKPMNIQVVVEGTSTVAQLLTDDGTRFSSPILLGEAGIYTDGAGNHYVPARRIITTEAELDSL